MKVTAFSILISLTALCFVALCQEAESTVVLEPRVARYTYDAIPKDPLASALFSATLPGTGQIYNKEYVRGVATGALFYASAITVRMLINHWEELNTDTFYIAETDGFGNTISPEIVHQATALKPDDEQVGLPTEEKVLLITALTIAGGSYVFGIIDSFLGARRYNEKLIASRRRKLDFDMAYSPARGRLDCAAIYRF
ncbi:MAG: hypothetical protein GF350_03705 [Chitinivibrionales bacterium]|nr:hypothetical protein [Chitinivibrionales bacterium]